jgi:hypothetical protein
MVTRHVAAVQAFGVAPDLDPLKRACERGSARTRLFVNDPFEV